MSLLEFRVALADGLEVRCQSGFAPCLAVRMTEDERTLLRSYGGSDHWRTLEAPLAPIRVFLFEDVPLRPDGRIGLSRIGRGRLRLSLSYRGERILERDYAETVFHTALRVAGHASALDEVCSQLVDRQYLNLRSALHAAAFELPVTAEAREDDPERDAWEDLWADDKPVPPPAPPPPVEMETFLPPKAREAEPVPVPIAAVEAEASPAPRTVEAPAAVAPAPQPRKAGIPKGPLKLNQLRLYAQSLRDKGVLPDSLSEAARLQVQAYAAQ